MDSVALSPRENAIWVRPGCGDNQGLCGVTGKNPEQLFYICRKLGSLIHGKGKSRFGILNSCLLGFAASIIPQHSLVWGQF